MSWNVSRIPGEHLDGDPGSLFGPLKLSGAFSEYCISFVPDEGIHMTETGPGPRSPRSGGHLDRR